MNKILIVDDEQDVCTVLKKVLEQDEFEADYFDDPHQPAPPRLNMKVTPEDAPGSAIEMRIDYDPDHGNEMVFDLEVHGRQSDVIATQNLRFPEASENHMVRQTKTHHFSTGVTGENLTRWDTNFSGLLEAMADKAEANRIDV